MDYMFACCSSLSSLPDTSKWNSSAIENSIYVFSTKKYGETINIRLEFSSGNFGYITATPDMTLRGLINKIIYQKKLNISKIENFFISLNNSFININIPQNLNKSIEEFQINRNGGLRIREI